MFDRRQRDREIASAHRVGPAAAEAGYRVRYTLASKLVNELVEAAADKQQLSKTISRYGRVDLLCLDLCRHRDYADDFDVRASIA